MALETPRSVGLVPPIVGLFPPLDHLHTSFRHSVVSFHGRGRVTPTEWIAFMEGVGIERTVLYPTAGLSCGAIPYPEVAIVLTRAYNDWLAATYVQSDARFNGMALLPMQVPEAAVEELRRAVEDLGFRGAMLPSNGLKGHLGSREYWPVYAEAERLGCCLSVHGGNHQGLGIDHLDVWQFVHALGHPVGQMISLAGLVANAVFDRYPGLRVAFLEGGVSWFLTCLERFDSSWASFRQLDPDGRFPRIPAGKKVSDYLMAPHRRRADLRRLRGRRARPRARRPAARLDTVLLLLRLPARGHGGDVSRGDRRAARAARSHRRRMPAAILYGNAERLYQFPAQRTCGNTSSAKR